MFFGAFCKNGKHYYIPVHNRALNLAAQLWSRAVPSDPLVRACSLYFRVGWPNLTLRYGNSRYCSHFERSLPWASFCQEGQPFLSLLFERSVFPGDLHQMFISFPSTLSWSDSCVSNGHLARCPLPLSLERAPRHHHRRRKLLMRTVRLRRLNVECDRSDRIAQRRSRVGDLLERWGYLPATFLFFRLCPRLEHLFWHFADFREALWSEIQWFDDLLWCSAQEAREVWICRAKRWKSSACRGRRFG